MRLPDKLTFGQTQKLNVTPGLIISNVLRKLLNKDYLRQVRIFERIKQASGLYHH